MEVGVEPGPLPLFQLRQGIVCGGAGIAHAAAVDDGQTGGDQLSDEAAGEDVMNLRLDLRRALAVLSEEERMIIGLSVYGGYQSQEISKILHIKDGTVRSKRSRAIGKMSMVLKKGGAGYE